MQKYNVYLWEEDNETFSTDAYKEREGLVAWHILGWEIENGKRTGRIVAVMVGDDRKYLFRPKDLVPIQAEEYCGSCGQIGCKAYE